MLKRYILLGLIMLNAVQMLHGQESGDTPSLGFGLTRPQSGVGSNTGALSVQLPLENLGMVPVALSYTATGIKVEQRAGMAGLGWDISTDAYIIREVRGKPDDQVNGYRSVGYKLQGTSLDFTTANNIRQGLWDSQPDVFRFRCFGFGGTFLIGPNNQIVNLSQDNVRIKPYTDGNGLYKFEITDPSGNVYIFDLIEEMSQKVDDKTAFVYRYKWHLTKVDLYNETNDISLIYTTGSSISEISYNTHKQSNNDLVGSDIITSSWSPNYLSKIEYGSYRMSLTYDYQRDQSGNIISGVIRPISQLTFAESSVTYATYRFNYDYYGINAARRLMLKSVQKTASGASMTLAGFQYYGDEYLGKDADGRVIGEFVLPEYKSYKKDHWGYFNNNTTGTLFVHEGANREPSLMHAQANSLKRMYISDKGYEEYEYQLNDYNGADNLPRTAGGLRIYKIKTSADGGTPVVSKTFSYGTSSTLWTSTGQIYALPQYERWREWSVENDEILDMQHFVYNTNSYRLLYDIMGRSVSYSRISVTNIDGSREVTNYHNFSDDNLEDNYYPNRYLYKMDMLGSSLSGHTTTLGKNDDTPYGHFSHFGSKAGLVKESQAYDINGKLVLKNVHTYQRYTSSAKVTGWKFLYSKEYSRRKPFSGMYTEYYYEYYVGHYLIQPHQYRLTRTESTAYNPSNAANFKKSIATVAYHPTLLLPTRTVSYLEGHSSNHMITETEYLYDALQAAMQSCSADRNACESSCEDQFYHKYQYCQQLTDDNERHYCIVDAEANRDNCYSQCEATFNSCVASIVGVSNILEHNLLTLVKSSQQFKDSRVLGRQEQFYANNASGHVLLDRSKTYLGSNTLTADVSFSYNSNGKLIRSLDSKTGNSQAFILDGLGRVLAQASDVDNSQIYYEGFETTGSTGVAKTGRKSFSGDFYVTFAKPAGNYTITYWYWDGSNWKYVSKPYHGPATLSEGTHLDEIRIFPQGSGMKTYAYDRDGQLKSETDINNISMSVDYDSFRRVSAVRNEAGDIIKSYFYNLINVNIPNYTLTCSEKHTLCKNKCDEDYKKNIASCGSRDVECMDMYQQQRLACYQSCDDALATCQD